MYDVKWSDFCCNWYTNLQSKNRFAYSRAWVSSCSFMISNIPSLISWWFFELQKFSGRSPSYSGLGTSRKKIYRCHVVNHEGGNNPDQPRSYQHHWCTHVFKRVYQLRSYFINHGIGFSLFFTAKVASPTKLGMPANLAKAENQIESVHEWSSVRGVYARPWFGDLSKWQQREKKVNQLGASKRWRSV